MAKVQQQATQPHWCPDFRIKEELPDIKVVRTRFLLNILSAFVLAGMCTLTVIREYKLSEIKSEINVLQNDIDGMTTRNRELLDLNGRFTKANNRIKEVVAFTPSIPLQEMILRISEVQPPEGKIGSIGISTEEAKGKEIVHIRFSGTMIENAEKSGAQLVNEFWLTLLELPMIKETLVAKNLADIRRNAQYGYFTYDISLELDMGKLKTKDAK